MKVVIQRVKSGAVTVDNQMVGAIQSGLLVYVGITHTDTEKEVGWIAEKIFSLRIFPDAGLKMNVDVQGAKGDLLIVSQFTLYGDLRKGTRPSFVEAAPPQLAETLYNALVDRLKLLSNDVATPEHRVAVHCGEFGAMMEVTSVNHGPVTIILER